MTVLIIQLFLGVNPKLQGATDDDDEEVKMNQMVDFHETWQMN